MLFHSMKQPSERTLKIEAHLSSRDAFQIDPLYFLPDCVRPVEHPVFVVDGEPARLRQVSVDDGPLERAGHRRPEDLPRRSKPPPIRVVERPSTTNTYVNNCLQDILSNYFNF